jgi:peptidyl-prolyl cis-trans isomerase SurA
MLGSLITCRSLLVGAMIAVAPVPTSAYAEQVVVDDGPITELEIEQRGKLNQLRAHKAPLREAVIAELRNEKLKIQAARNSGVEITDTEVDQTYAMVARRMRLTTEQLTEYLARSGISVDTLKHLIRADIASGRLPRRAPRSDIK